jgi:long-chain acyl-CoA synthetase
MRRSVLEYFHETASLDKRYAYTTRNGLRRRRSTFAEVAALSYGLSDELIERGIGAGDRILIWSENSPEWVAAFFAILLCRAIAVPLDETSDVAFVGRVQQQTNAKLVLVGNQDSSSVEIPTINLSDIDGFAVKRSFDASSIPVPEPNEIVEIVYTSGTTAEPKGVILTHENLLANLEPIEREVRKRVQWKFLIEPIKIMCALPLSHVFGQMMGIFIPHMIAAEVVFQNSFNPNELISTIKLERVALLASVPRVLESLRRNMLRKFPGPASAGDAERHGGVLSWLVTRWKYRKIHSVFGQRFFGFATGGATLDPATENFWRRLGFAVIQGYGMTETAALVSLNNPFSTRRGSLGQVLSGRDNIRIGEHGEILVRGKSVSPGYWGETSADDAAEWLDTGDIGELDESGLLLYKGRRKDVIVTAAGLNIYPSDVEAALNMQPQIVDSAVIGIDTENGPEYVAAVIVPPGGDASLAIENANRMLADFQRLRRWIEWPDVDFPRTATQKVKKNVIAARIRDSVDKGPVSMDVTAAPIKQIIQTIANSSSFDLRDDAKLSEDLGLDSLSRVELLSAIESQYQVDVDEQDFIRTNTIGDIERLIRGERDLASARIKFEYPWWTLSQPAQAFRSIFNMLVIQPITRFLCRANVEGIENLRNVSGPVIFASNHVTYVDPPIIMSAMPPRFRRHLAIAMDGERQYNYRHPPPGTRLITRLRGFFTYWPVILFFNAFPLPRQGGFRESFKFAGEAMDRGNSILIFPEGELTKTGEMQKFRSGIGLLAEGLNAPIVPVALSGLYQLKTSGRRGWAPAGIVTVRFGQPIGRDAGADPQDITRKLEEEIRSLTADDS